MRHATHINWIECSEVSIDGAAWLAQFIRYSSLQQFCRLCRLAMVQRKKRANRWHVIESDGSIFGKVFFEVIGECLCLGRIPRECQCKGRAELHLPVLSKRKGFHRATLCRGRIPEKGFPQRHPGFEYRCLFPMARLLCEVHGAL